MMCSLFLTTLSLVVAELAAGTPGVRADSGATQGRETAQVDAEAPAVQTRGCPDATITIEIMTDQYPEDTTWELTERGGGVVDSAEPLSSAHTLHTWDVCADSQACYDFVIHDSFGDGICCGQGSGYYNVYYEGVIVGSGSAFQSVDNVFDIGAGCQPSVCGDGTCEVDETCDGCPADCGVCPYCDACYTNTTDDWITNVRFHTIDNSSSQDGPCSYGDYTALSTSVDPESEYTLSVSFFSNGKWTEHVRAWIDWNQDNTFDSTESYYLGSGVDATLSRQIVVPADAMIGCTIMRVIENFEMDPPTPCPDLFFGETEDYSVCVSGVEMGACCVDSAPWCLDLLPETECEAQAGTFLGNGSACGALDCNGNASPDGCDLIDGGDFDANGIIDLADYRVLAETMAGPTASPNVPSPECLSAYLAAFDMDADGDVDLEDFAAFERLITP